MSPSYCYGSMDICIYLCVAIFIFTFQIYNITYNGNMHHACWYDVVQYIVKTTQSTYMVVHHCSDNVLTVVCCITKILQVHLFCLWLRCQLIQLNRAALTHPGLPHLEYSVQFQAPVYRRDTRSWREFSKGQLRRWAALRS